MSGTAWELARRLGAVLRNPFFTNELRRPGRRAFAAGLALLNGAYVAWFALSWIGRSGSHTAGPAVRAAFNELPWLAGGALLLSLCAHWLMPPSLLELLGERPALRSLRLLVGGRHSDDDLLHGQVAAGVVPLLLGAAPLALGAAALTCLGSPHAPAAAAALAGAVLWGALAAGVSFWSGTCRRPPALAAAWAYLILTVALPPALGAASALVALGCSAGRPDRDSVFFTAAALTWCLLVIGLAAAFWDFAYGRLFPERRRSLWVVTEPAAPRGHPLEP